MRPEGLSEGKHSNDTIGNRTRDLPACSAVPQPTAPARAFILCVDFHNVLDISLVMTPWGKKKSS